MVAHNAMKDMLILNIDKMFLFLNYNGKTLNRIRGIIFYLIRKRQIKSIINEYDNLKVTHNTCSLHLATHF